MKRALPLTVILLTLLSAGCGSSTLGDLGSILGSSGTTNPSDVQGVVRAVDTSNQRIDLDVNYVNGLRPSSSATNAIYYDSQTVVEYQGNSYRPDSLERGDQITVRGVSNSGRYVAERITVVRNVRG